MGKAFGNIYDWVQNYLDPCTNYYKNKRYMKKKHLRETTIFRLQAKGVCPCSSRTIYFKFTQEFFEKTFIKYRAF